MITPFDIYLISIAGTIANASFVVALLATIVGIVTFFYHCSEFPHYETETEEQFRENNKRAKRWKRVSFSLAFVFIVLWAFLPSTKTLTAMYILPAFDTKAIESLPQNAAKLANEWMKEEAKEIAKNEQN